MSAPIRPGTAARLGLHRQERAPRFELTITGLTAKQERELRDASSDWFARLAAQPGWSRGPILPIADDWDGVFRFGPPIPPAFEWPPDEPRRRWWHRRNR